MDGVENCSVLWLTSRTIQSSKLSVVLRQEPKTVECTVCLVCQAWRAAPHLYTRSLGHVSYVNCQMGAWMQSVWTWGRYTTKSIHFSLGWIYLLIRHLFMTKQILQLFYSDFSGLVSECTFELSFDSPWQPSLQTQEEKFTLLASNLVSETNYQLGKFLVI